MVCRAIGRTCQGHVTDPKTLPLYNKLKESKVNSRNVLSAQPSWVNRRSPPLLPGRRPAERAPASHGRPSPPPAALSAGGRRAGGLRSPPRLPHLVLPHPTHVIYWHLVTCPNPRVGGAGGAGKLISASPALREMWGAQSAAEEHHLPVRNSQSPFLLAFPRKPREAGSILVDRPTG